MKAGTNRWLQVDEHTVDDCIKYAQDIAEDIHGKDFNSEHELYALLQEELDEFFDSIKAKDPDPKELLDILVLARGGLIWLCKKNR